MTSMTPDARSTPADFPGRTLGVVGLVLAFLVPLVGAIVSAVALSQSKKAGYPNTLARVGVIVGAVLTVLGLIISIISIIASAAAYMSY